jgi:hypothetical protein
MLVFSQSWAYHAACDCTQCSGIAHAHDPYVCLCGLKLLVAALAPPSRWGSAAWRCQRAGALAATKSTVGAGVGAFLGHSIWNLLAGSGAQDSTLLAVVARPDFKACPGPDLQRASGDFPLLLRLAHGVILLLGGHGGDLARRLPRWWQRARGAHRRRDKGMAAAGSVAPVVPPVAPNTPVDLGGAAGQDLVGRYVVILNSQTDDLDEFMLAAAIPGTDAQWIVWTTSDVAPHSFEFRVMQLRAGSLPHGGFRVVEGTGITRHPPRLERAYSYNMICSPVDYAPWAATPADLASIRSEAQSLAVLFQTALLHNPDVNSVTILPRVQLRDAEPPAAPRTPEGVGGGIAAAAAQAARLRLSPTGPPPGGAVLPHPVAAAAGLGGLGQGAGVGLGFPGGGGGGVPAGYPAVPSLELMQEVAQLRSAFDSLQMELPKKAKKSKKSREKKEKREKKDKKDRNTKDKRKKRSRSASGSSSSSSSSSSRSSDTDEMGTPNEKYMQWVGAGAKKTKFDQALMIRHHTLRFKRRSDLVNFAMRYPGGLTAHFLAQVKAKMGQPLPLDTHELGSVDPTSWASSMSELKDVRDQKEVSFLAKILAELNRGRYSQLADLVTMRIREIRVAKKDGGSWDKAGVLSLQPGAYPANAPLPDGAFII